MFRSRAQINALGELQETIVLREARIATLERQLESLRKENDAIRVRNSDLARELNTYLVRPR